MTKCSCPDCGGKLKIWFDMNAYGSDWPVGSVIEMFDETLRIRENLGHRGVVETLDGEFVSSRFYWQFGSDKAILISTPDNQG